MMKRKMRLCWIIAGFFILILCCTGVCESECTHDFKSTHLVSAENCTREENTNGIGCYVLKGTIVVYDRCDICMDRVSDNYIVDTYIMPHKIEADGCCAECGKMFINRNAFSLSVIAQQFEIGGEAIFTLNAKNLTDYQAEGWFVVECLNGSDVIMPEGMYGGDVYPDDVFGQSASSERMVFAAGEEKSITVTARIPDNWSNAFKFRFYISGWYDGTMDNRFETIREYPEKTGVTPEPTPKPTPKPTPTPTVTQKPESDVRDVSWESWLEYWEEVYPDLDRSTGQYHYWNHDGMLCDDNHVQDTVTIYPCNPAGGNHLYTATGTIHCNNSGKGSWQCQGFIDKLTYHATGAYCSDASNGWSYITYSDIDTMMANLRVGDALAWGSSPNAHWLLVTGVYDSYIGVLECNIAPFNCLIFRGYRDAKNGGNQWGRVLLPNTLENHEYKGQMETLQYTMNSYGSMRVYRYSGTLKNIPGMEAEDGLSVFTLSASLRIIQDEAFLKNNADKIIVPEGTEKIGMRAFAYSQRLREICLPESVVEISEDAFEGCDNLILICAKGSYSETFAIENGLNYRVE